MSTAKTAKFRESIKQEILALTAKGYGISAACKKVGITRPTYYNWKKKDPHFARELNQILSDPVHQQRLLDNQATADIAVDMTWAQKFIATYRRTGDKVKSAQTAGKTTVELSNCLDPKHDSYDEEFHLAFLEEEQRRIWTIEDSTLAKAEHDGPTARFVLSNLLKDKYGKVSEGSVQVNQHWHTQAGSDQAGEFLDGLFGEATDRTGSTGSTERTDQGSAPDADQRNQTELN